MRTELPRAETGRGAWAACLLVACVLSGVSRAATYYADASATGNADGTSWADAWPSAAAAIAGLDALEGNGSGDTLLCRGNLGPWIEGASTEYGANVERTDWLVVADDDGTGRLTYVNIRNSVANNSTIKFSGLMIRPNDPDPWPTDDGYWHYDEYPFVVSLFNANDIWFYDCEIRGVTEHGKYLTGYLYTVTCDRLVVERCHIHDLTGGVWVVGGDSAEIKNNYFHDLSHYSVVSIRGNATGTIIIRDNHLTGIGYDLDAPYCPDPDLEGSDWHAGTGFAIRATAVGDPGGEPTWDHLYIQRNLIHDCRIGQAIMLYDSSGDNKYNNMTIENNCVYDSAIVRLWYLYPTATSTTIIRNNTIVGYLLKTGTAKYDILQRFYGGGLAFSYLAGDPNYLVLTNNIFVEYRQSDVTVGDYNFWWVPNGYDLTGYEGANSILAVWRDASLNLHGNPNYLEDIGYRDSTDEYDYDVDGITPVFVSPGFATGSTYDEDRGKQWDYRLITGSPLINAGDSAAQSSTSLGSLGADGFLRNDGVARDASHHSLGAYEFGTPPDEWVMEGGNGGNGGGTTRYFLGSR